MKTDLHLSFGEIFKDLPSFRAQLHEIQTHIASRAESENWVSRLRFLDISAVPDLDRFDEEPHGQRQRLFHSKGGNQMFWSGRPRRLEIPVTKRKHDDGEEPYVAVSWRWVSKSAERALPYGCDWQKSYDYQIRRPGTEPHKSDFPDIYMDRVVRFAQHMGITKLWIDKECIYQRDGDDEMDKDLGTQIMDVVYGDSTYSVGLLTVALMHQHEIDTLSALLSKSIFLDGTNTSAPVLKPSTNKLEVQTIILRILSDPRWDRAWVFQEDHLASARMVLLIPHSEHLEKGDKYDFGDIPNDLQVKLYHFKTAVTMFCFATGEEMRWPCSEILRKAKQYNVWNKKQFRVYNAATNRDVPGIRLWHDRDDGIACRGKINTKNTYAMVTSYPGITLNILEDIINKNLSNEEDRIAILANAAQFPLRLDTSKNSPLVKSNYYSLSTALLALIIMNGEIIKNTASFMDNSLLNLTLLEYLKRVEFEFNPPTFRYEQTFISHCRFKAPVHITPTGSMSVQGYLFKLLPAKPAPRPNPLRLSKCDRDELSDFLQNHPNGTVIPRGRRFSPYGRQVLRMLNNKLIKTKATQLAMFLAENMDLDCGLLRPAAMQDTKRKLSRTKYVLDMMCAVVQALLDEQPLRLARLDNEDDSTPASAIFITPRPPEYQWLTEWVTKNDAGGAGLARVFTSWDNGSRLGGTHSLAQVEVAICCPREGMKRDWDDGVGDDDAERERAREERFLSSCSWVNGIWDARGKKMSRYTFPLSMAAEVGGFVPPMKQRMVDELTTEVAGPSS